jgi:hypothetical protein
LIEGRYFPEQRLQLEMFTESQIASREHTDLSLKELFEFTNGYLSLLTEAALDFTQPEASTPL